MADLRKKYEKITEARLLLELPEEATMKEIKMKYKSLAMKWHPDKSKADPVQCHEMMQKINAAYQMIMAYCESYKFSFKQESVEKYLSPIERWMDQFGTDPLWGP